MKKRFLPIGFFTLFILGLIVLFLLPSVKEVTQSDDAKRGAQTIAGAKAYLASIRNNQTTGLLNPKDVISARKQLDANNYKAGNADEFQWTELGPENVGGRTRALIFDNRDSEAKTMYAGSVTGGIFKTTNLAATWEKVNTTSGTANLNATCMVQSSDGTIYVGTGEGLSTENYTITGNLGYEGGFVGKGIFKSDNSDNFSLVEGTSPVIEGDVAEWAYINELAIDTKNNRLFAATGTGLMYANLPDLDNWSNAASYTVDSLVVNRNIEMDSLMVCDSITNDNGQITIHGSTGWQVSTSRNDTSSVDEFAPKTYIPFETQGNCYDVKVNPDGVIVTMFNNKVYVSGDGNVEHFVNRSIYPENPESVRQDVVSWVTTLMIKDKNGEILYESGNTTQETIDWHIDYYLEAESSTFDEYPHSDDAGRTEFAFAPSSPNIVYALASDNGDKSLLGVYMSGDNGQSWRTIAPGGSSSLNILGAKYSESQSYYQGDFCNTLTVFPNDPYRILAGGINLWIGKRITTTGPYSWARKSESDATLPNMITNDQGGIGGIFHPLYVHMDHHTYVFRPGYGNKFVAGTDGGIYQGTITGNDAEFFVSNTNYNCTQFYTIATTFVDDIMVGGTQDNGPLLTQGGFGADMWRGANIPFFYPDGCDGASVAMSNLFSSGPDNTDFQLPTSYYSRTEHPEGDVLDERFRRSETLGEDFAVDFVSGFNDDIFINPMLLWESFNNENSRDSVKYTADTNYVAGDMVMVRSNHIKHPFNYNLPVDMAKGDTLMVQDIFSEKLFVAKTDAIYMSIDAYDFTVTPSWWEISATSEAGFEGLPLCLAASEDGNMLYVGTTEGRLWKISNIALAYNEDLADVGSSNCIIATHELDLGGNTQAITSVAVDPTDANKVIVTLGNYGNTDYVFFSSNAMSDTPDFTSVQGELPAVPVYSSLLELDPETNQAIIGTEIGLWVCDDITSSSPDWYKSGSEIGEVPIMALKQQTKLKGAYTITYYDPVTNAPSYEVYAPVLNYGNIYAATHGRGIFVADLGINSIDDNLATDNTKEELQLSVYPNPAVDDVTISIDLQESSEAQLAIFDLTGKLVLSRDLGRVSNGTNNIPVNLSKLTQGTYLIQVNVGTSKATSKIIINK